MTDVDNSWEEMKGHLSKKCQQQKKIINYIVVIGIDCTGSCKSNYHTITTTTALANAYSYSKFYGTNFIDNLATMPYCYLNMLNVQFTLPTASTLSAY